MNDSFDIRRADQHHFYFWFWHLHSFWSWRLCSFLLETLFVCVCVRACVRVCEWVCVCVCVSEWVSEILEIQVQSPVSTLSKRLGSTISLAEHTEQIGENLVALEGKSTNDNKTV
jgi:hypothetical protein